MSSLDLGAFLKETIREQEISISNLARRASLSRESIYRLIRGDSKEPDLSTIVRIGRVLQIHPIVLLRQLFRGWEFQDLEQPNAAKKLDAIGFLGDMTYPDNAIVSVATEFTKIWEIQNIGESPWQGRKMRCIDDVINIMTDDNQFTLSTGNRGLLPSLNEVEIEETAPGETVCISVAFKAPDYPCTAISYWKMINATGEFCFPEHEGLSCTVKVVSF